MAPTPDKQAKPKTAAKKAPAKKAPAKKAAPKKKAPAKRKRSAKARPEKGRMVLYDVTVVDTATGEAIDQRRLDCSCWLFRSWVEGGLDDPYGGQYPDTCIILVEPH